MRRIRPAISLLGQWARAGFRALALLGFTACAAASATAAGPVEGAGAVKATIRVTREELVEKPVSPLIYGNFIESGFGRQVEGMWAEMLFNRSFEHVPPYTAATWGSHEQDPNRITKGIWYHSGYEEQPWYLVPGNKGATLETARHSGFHKGLQATVLRNRSGDKWAAFAQNGIYLRRGERYEFSGVLRCSPETWQIVPDGDTLDAVVCLYPEGKWSNPIVRVPIKGIGAVFERFSVTLDNPHFQGRATFSLWIPPNSVLIADDLSLMPASNVHGWRKELVEAARRVNARILRWPGGCFASFYDWRDGIGPRPSRTARPSKFWGGLCQNDVGTAEFIQFCRLVEAEPFICVNVMTATAEDAAEWVAYCNAPASHPVGALRKRDGFAEPFGVTYWELGNETFRKFGPRQYAQRCVEYARAMRAVDPTIKLVLIGYGAYWRHLEEMLEIAGEHIDVVADRAVDGRWLQRDLEIIRAYNAKHDTAIQLCNTEWPAPIDGVSGAFGPGDRQRFRTHKTQQMCWRSAMNTARAFLLFQRLGGDFVFSNFNNFANTWGQNVVECPKEGVYLSAAGRVFEVFSRSPAAWPLRLEGTERFDNFDDGLDVAVQAAWDAEREGLCLFVVNTRAQRLELSFDLRDLERPFSTSRTTILRAPSPLTVNTLRQPGAVEGTRSGEAITEPHTHSLSVPPYSVVHVVLK